MRPPEIFSVGHGIWCVRRARQGVCCYVVATDPGAVLIDSGMLSSGSDPMMALQQARVGLSSVRGLVLTHWHPEHASGAAALKARSGCRVYYSEEELPRVRATDAPDGVGRGFAEKLREQGPLGAMRSIVRPVSTRPVNPDHCPVDGELLFDGAFRVIKTPGHTEGHLALYHVPSKALFAGDALSVVDGELCLPTRSATDDVDAVRESVRRLLDQDFRLVLPGRRAPLVENVQRQRRLLLDLVSSSPRWQLPG